MTTPGSIANNRYSYVSTGVSQFGGEPISYGRVQLLVILTGLCVSGATVGIMRNRRDNDDKQYKEGAMSFIQSLKDKSNLIVGGGLIYIAIAEYSSEVPYPWEVPGAGVVLTAGFAALVFGYLGAGKLDEFLPDENGIFLIAFQASDDTGGAIWEITEDQFDAMEVHSGTLFEWPTAKRVYEVKEYRPRKT